jgi:hypothetical protein
MTDKQKKIAACLHELELKNNGLLVPQNVVFAARDEASPLHGEFDWNDETAAEAHRLEQAKRLIRSVRYEEIVVKTEIKCPQYVHITTPGSPSGYVSIHTIKNDTELKKQVLFGEISRARLALERARSIAGVLGCAEELEHALEHLLMLQIKAA